MLPSVVALPIREALCACRADPPAHWPPAAFRLVARPDLAVPIGASPPAPPVLIGHAASRPPY